MHGDPPCMPPSPPHTQHVCAPQAPRRQALAGQTVRTEESRLRNAHKSPSTQAQRYPPCTPPSPPHTQHVCAPSSNDEKPWHSSGQDSENQTVSSGPASAPSTQAVPSSATHRKHRPRRHPSTTPAHPQTSERFDTRIGRPPAPKQQITSPPVTLRLPPEHAAHRTYLVSCTTGKHHAPHRDARARRATERAAHRIPCPE